MGSSIWWGIERCNFYWTFWMWSSKWWKEWKTGKKNGIFMDADANIFCFFTKILMKKCRFFLPVFRIHNFFCKKFMILPIFPPMRIIMLENLFLMKILLNFAWFSRIKKWILIYLYQKHYFLRYSNSRRIISRMILWKASWGNGNK